MPTSSLPAEAREKLLPSTQQNLERLLHDPAATTCDRAAIAELLERKAWTELDDRFFRDLAFGTGGMRGRTIGKIVTASETGTLQALDRPQFPGAGTNLLNYENVRRAVSALGAYLRETYPGEKWSVVIAHDTRFFSPEFAHCAADALNALGIDALLFPGDRSTPQLSFSVRHLRAHAGIMITASHNPPHDNGMKFYARDGGQVVEPHASGITRFFQRLSENPALLHELIAAGQKGHSTILDETIDAAYQAAVAHLVLEPAAISATRDQISFVYTPLHGTGARAIPPLLDRFGFRYSVVPGQNRADGRFPTVKSPNPENAEALELAIKQAEVESADVVIATDPDADRMGVAVRDASGKMILLTGNQIGSILAHYRCERLRAQGILTAQNSPRAVIVKTIVTTDLQQRIAEKFGIGCIDTLTGFKYIGEKMLDYETALADPAYDQKSTAERRAEMLARSRFVVFAGEESYGYTGGDYVRDKDANAAALMFAEVAAWTKSQGSSIAQYLDAIYRELGYYTERLGTLTFEGAQGAQQIARLLASFRGEPPKTFQGQKVIRLDDYGQSDFHDADGKLLPKETVLFFHLDDGGRMGVRASGTEPKIKFYFFTRAHVTGDLAAIKTQRKAFLDAWWDEVQSEVKKRVG